MKKIYLLLTLSFFFTGCENSDTVECYLIDDLIVDSNSPVINGNDILLTSEYDGNTFEGEFVWTGPNGYTSNERNPVITNASIDNIGEYKVKFKRGICESDEVTLVVDVIVNNTVTCQPNNNTGTFSNQFYPFNYYTVSSSFSNNQYNLIGSDVNSSIRIIFPNTNTPVSGIYSIVDNFGSNSQNQVKVNTTIGYVYYNPLDYYAKSGHVLISFTNSSKMVAIFCNVGFYTGSYSSPSFSGTVKITED